MTKFHIVYYPQYRSFHCDFSENARFMICAMLASKRHCNTRPYSATYMAILPPKINSLNIGFL